MSKFGMKVPHLRCDSHTSFKVKWSKVMVGGGRGHTVSAEPGGHTACFTYFVSNKDEMRFFKNEMLATTHTSDTTHGQLAPCLVAPPIAF